MTTITLYRGADSWLAHWQGDDAAEIKRLFGTDILPTAYTAQAAGDTVQAEISRLNPERVVRLG
jgi:hypothetical protein